MDVSDIFFFCSGEGKGEFEATQRGGGAGWFSIENPRRGGLQGGEGGARGLGGCLREFGGRGARYFFGGPKCPQSNCFRISVCNHFGPQSSASFSAEVLADASNIPVDLVVDMKLVIDDDETESAQLSSPLTSCMPFIQMSHISHTSGESNRPLTLILVKSIAML